MSSRVIRPGVVWLLEHVAAARAVANAATWQRLAQAAVDVLDDLLLLFDQAISGRESHAKAKLREKLAERAK